MCLFKYFSACPPKWTQVGDVCVHYNKYRWNFDFAKKFCIETGGQLYEPRNATTEAAIRSWVANFHGFFPGNKGPWIGVTDITSEGKSVTNILLNVNILTKLFLIVSSMPQTIN